MNILKSNHLKTYHNYVNFLMNIKIRYKILHVEYIMHL